MASTPPGLLSGGQNGPLKSRKRPVPSDFELPQPSRPLPQELVQERINRKMELYDKWIKEDLYDASIVRHPLNDDCLPEQPMYHPAFAQAEQACQNISQQMLTRLRADEGTQLATLLMPKLLEASLTDRTESELVGFLGQPGHGKSKAVGVLLGTEELTIKGASGESVTRVPIVYSHRQSATVATAYEARLTVCDKRTCRDMVRTHLGCVLSKTDPHDPSADMQHRDQSDTSEETLKGLFANRPEFASDVAINPFLFPANGDHDVYETFEEWGEEQRNKIVEKTRAGIFAANPDQLWARIAPYAGVSLDQTAPSSLSFDPSSLIEKIEIFGTHRLRLSLGDFPGLGDHNKDHETKTWRQLDRCKVVVVAREISRAGSCKFLAEFLEERHIRNPDQSIIVVLTKIDQGIDVKSRIDAKFSATQLVELEYLEQRERSISAQVNGFPRPSHALRDRLKFERKCIKLEQVEIFTQERIQRVEHKLRSMYYQMTNGRQLSIISTSAKAYSDVTKGYSQFDADEFPLSVELSGVPRLVNELARIPCERVQSNLLDHWGVTLPRVLSWIELCCNTASAQQVSYLPFKADDKAMEFEEDLRAKLNAFDREYVKPLIDFVHQSRPVWTKTARSLCDDWQNENPKTYWACLRKGGRHLTQKGTQKGRRHDWNRDLLRLVQRTLDKYVRKLVEDTKPFFSNWSKEIQRKVNSSIKTLRRQVSSSECGAFLENIESNQSLMLRKLCAIQMNIKDSIGNMTNRATNDRHGNFFTSAMTDVYKEACMTTPVKGQSPSRGSSKVIKGGPTWARRFFSNSKGQSRHQAASKVFKSRVCADDGPFHAIAVGLEDMWEKEKEKLIEFTMRPVREILRDIQRSYDGLGVAEQGEDQASLRLREDLLRMVKQARKDLKGDILTWLLKCELDPNLKWLKPLSVPA